MKVKLVKESLNESNNSNLFLLNLIEGLMQVLLKGNHSFIDFEHINIQNFENLRVEYASPIPPKKQMEIYIGKSINRDYNYFLNFKVGKHAGLSMGLNWDPTPNMDENIKDIVDAMSYWGWYILPASTKKTYEKPYSRIWEEGK